MRKIFILSVLLTLALVISGCGTLLYITQTAQPVIIQGEVVDPIRILVEPV